MLIANADSAAVVEKIVIATCSLISIGQRADMVNLNEGMPEI